ncbi:conserved hypothetical protein [Verticillium alfalfae VaMs.102]|uniref:Uncharacterized protein n=1 Tax=Verticillium alfalfae (strain VaMs.102 / ATCC MYA-4576 / FGSC 10136) TaxID=526221 RepID=C9SR30_VERA1|nr:conserved hypothetical protein [Verticillium alfalfae VaMs.102]EEY21305.1 conserved hypothetical protein [Verticillium alfalfae VaMs.102]
MECFCHKLSTHQFHDITESEEIKDALPHIQNTIRDKVYHITRIGENWKEIIGDSASSTNVARSTSEDCFASFRQRPLEHSFVEETRGITSRSQSLLGTTAMPRPNRSSLPSRAVPVRRDSNAPSGAQSACNSSLAAVSEAVGLGGSRPSLLRIEQSHEVHPVCVEDLSTAKRWLKGWSPLEQTPSVLEKVVLFRKHMILGRLLRFRGAFRESLTCLKNAQTTIGQCKDLIFDEDLRDLTCDQADTLRELGDLTSAEYLLRAEITRRDQSSMSSGHSLLELSLAEALFAQGCFQEADKLCLDVQSRPGLLRLEKLRLHITMAKIRHMKSDNEGALCCWSGALKEIRKFQLTNGRTTRIITMSICDTLASLGETWLVDESMKQVASVDGSAKPGGVEWWFAGMRHWLASSVEKSAAVAMRGRADLVMPPPLWASS